ncbi:diacylglycerol/lipid kinase family protein [Isoptericola jiangsuensis]|uniref:diacylglycerol/lipid kinase family protein n=1 Tax=Isoptericola jiangsuensis TaxID=548579 RepID=UPI003AAFA2D8
MNATGRLHRVGLAVNPTAGGGRGRAAGARVAVALRTAGHDVVDLSGVDAPDAARHLAAATGLDALVVVGGDGMVHLGVQAVAGTPVALGVVAVGTGNDFAAATHLPPSDRDAALRGLTSALHRASTRPVDAIRVTSTSGEARWVAGAVSAGLDAAVNARANTLRWRGPSRYTLAALAEIAAFRAWEYTLRFTGLTDDGGLHLTRTGEEFTWTGRAAMVTAANISRIGGGIRVAPDAVADDGLLDVLVAPVLTRTAAATIFPAMFTGRHTRRRDVHVLRAREVTVDGTALPVAHGDGEPLPGAPLTATAVPGALQLLHPPGPAASNPAGAP